MLRMSMRGLLTLGVLLLAMPSGGGARRRKTGASTRLPQLEEPPELLREVDAARLDVEGGLQRLHALCSAHPHSFEAAVAYGQMFADKRARDEQEGVQLAARAAAELGRGLNLTKHASLSPRLVNISVQHLDLLRTAHAEHYQIIPAGMQLLRRFEHVDPSPSKCKAIAQYFGWESAKVEMDLLKDGAELFFSERQDMWNEIAEIGTRLNAKGCEWGFGLRAMLLHKFAYALALDAQGDAKGASRAFADVPSICAGRSECETDNDIIRLFASLQAQSRYFARVTWAGVRGQVAPPMSDYDPDVSLAGWRGEWGSSASAIGTSLACCGWNDRHRQPSIHVNSGEPVSSSCNIDRRQNLTSEEFHSTYVAAGRPVLINGLLDDWPGRKLWNRDTLLQSAGHERVRVLLTSQVSSAEQHLGAANRSELSLLDYVTEYLNAPIQEQSKRASDQDAPYVFEKGLPTAIKGGFRHPFLFDSKKFFPKSLEERENGAYFFVGNRGSGTGFHSHDHAYNALLFGRKHWFLLPPVSNYGALGPSLAALRDATDAMRRGLAETMLDSVRPRLLECEQHAGEVLFVPSMWSHAIINEQAVMGVAVQVGWSWANA